MIAFVSDQNGWINQILDLLTRLQSKEGFLQIPAKEGQEETGEQAREEGEPGDAERNRRATFSNIEENGKLKQTKHATRVS